MKNMNNIKLKEWLRKTGGETPLWPNLDETTNLVSCFFNVFCFHPDFSFLSPSVVLNAPQFWDTLWINYNHLFHVQNNLPTYLPNLSIYNLPTYLPNFEYF
jgi:hypothetical protein